MRYLYTRYHTTQCKREGSVTLVIMAGSMAHPKHYSRTQRPVKYYFVDFGISRRYNPDDGPPLEYPIFGGGQVCAGVSNIRQPMQPIPN